MRWYDLKQGDVIHYLANYESYVLLDDARVDGIYVRFRVLCLDDGQVYNDANYAENIIHEQYIAVDQAPRNMRK